MNIILLSIFLVSNLPFKMSVTDIRHFPADEAYPTGAADTLCEG